MRALAIILSTLALSTLIDCKTEYGVIMDAGSSGTKLYIYEWLTENRPSLYEFPDIGLAPLNMPANAKWSTKISPGISSYARDIPSLIGNMSVLINYAKTKIPTNGTLLYLKATAGMRFLPEADQNVILEGIRDYVATTGFTTKREWIKVIRGEEEGNLGWVSVNYLKSALGKPTSATFGSLDLGGASTQIAFASDNLVNMGNDTELIKFSENVKYTLYSRSYLGLGVDKVYSNMIEMLKTADKPTIVYPCYPTGYFTQYVDSEGKSYNVTGSSDFNGCRNLNLRFLQSFPDSPFNNNNLPVVDTLNTFYGFSAFFFTYDFYNLTQGNAMLRDVLNATSAYCALNVTEAQKYAGTKINFQRLCMYGVHVYGLLVDGYKFNPNTVQVIPALSLNDIELGWAPGAMVYEASNYYANGTTIMTTTASTVSGAARMAAFPMMMMISGLMLLVCAC